VGKSVGGFDGLNVGGTIGVLEGEAVGIGVGAPGV